MNFTYVHYCRHFETQNLSVYIRHLKTIHSKRKEVLCDQCGVSFNRKDALRSHKNAVHGSGVKKPYVCELCGKAFRCNVSSPNGFASTINIVLFCCQLSGTASDQSYIERQII